jgi:predicted phage-related endonuclease
MTTSRSEVKVIQGTPEWLAARAGHLTGTSANDLFATVKNGEAAGRANLRERLVLETILGRPEIVDLKHIKAVAQGIEREPMARSAFECETGQFVTETGFWLIDGLRCGASPDGLVGDNALIQIKCPEIKAHMATWRKPQKVPTVYVKQVQWELWVTGRALSYFMSWNPEFPDDMQTVVIPVERDPVMHEQFFLAAQQMFREVDADVEATQKQRGKA